MAYPLIGTHPIDGITPHEALAVLRKVEANGRYESARRMRSVLSRVSRYGIATARCERDVAADLRGALTTPGTTHHAAIVEPREVGVLLKTIDGYSGHGERFDLPFPGPFDHFNPRSRASRSRTNVRSLSRNVDSIAGINSATGSSRP